MRPDESWYENDFSLIQYFNLIEHIQRILGFNFREKNYWKETSVEHEKSNFPPKIYREKKTLQVSQEQLVTIAMTIIFIKSREKQRH